MWYWSCVVIVTSGEQRKPAHMTVDQAVSCGPIVNELISNARRHAFPGGRSGAIPVELRRNSQKGMIQLGVADDGVGMPADLDVAARDSLGLKLVYTLTEQLGDHIVLNRVIGTAFQITFSTNHG